MNDSKETVPSIYNRIDAHVNPNTGNMLRACTVSRQMESKCLGNCVNGLQPITKRLSAIDTCCKRKNSFLQYSLSAHQKVGYMTSKRWQHKPNSMIFLQMFFVPYCFIWTFSFFCFFCLIDLLLLNHGFQFCWFCVGYYVCIYFCSVFFKRKNGHIVGWLVM